MMLKSITMLPSVYPEKHKRHSVDQCAAEQVRGRSVRATPSTLRGLNSRSINLQTLHIKGASETTVKILLQRKHQRGALKRPDFRHTFYRH